MELTHEELEHLAELSRLALSEGEQKKMGQDLGQILGYVDRLQALDTAGVLEVSNTEAIEVRSDEARPMDDAERSLILADFPERIGDVLSVPAVFEQPKR